jgi:hypothetical protein
MATYVAVAMSLFGGDPRLALPRSCSSSSFATSFERPRYGMVIAIIAFFCLWAGLVEVLGR